jgi:UrcA family protein
MNQTISKRNPAVSLALLAVSVAINLTAYAAVAKPPEPGVRTLVVRYYDIDLTRPEGAQVLYRRIGSAARQACGYLDIRDLKGNAEFDECYARAVDDAVAQVNSPMLTALHHSRSRTRLASG